MKTSLLLVFFFLGVVQFSLAQKEPAATVEVSLLGTKFVDQNSFGFSIGASRNWHEHFQIGFSLQSAFNGQRDTFGYGVGSPFYSIGVFTVNNTAQLYSVGNFSIDANANFGWLNINLQDEDLASFDPFFGFVESETIAQENFRFLQGGLTLNYIISKNNGLDVGVFVRALKNQALGNVRFGGEDANSNFQFNLGVKVYLF